MRQLKGPVLIYFVRHGYKHFALFKGIRGDRVYLADPARGNIRLSLYRFESEWTGYIQSIEESCRLMAALGSTPLGCIIFERLGRGSGAGVRLMVGGARVVVLRYSGAL